MKNTIKTIILFGCLALLLITIGRLVGGINGMWLMLGISLLMNLGVYFYSDKIAIMSAGAKPLNSQKYPEVKAAVSELVKKGKLPMPKLYVSLDLQPNAFATGRNPTHSAVVVTKGLTQILDRDELKGVLAHELSHVRNRDVLIATAASVVASVIVTVSSVLRWGMIFGGSNENRNPLGELFAIIIAPIAAAIIQLAISRSREFEADHDGAKLAGSGEGLASALEKIEQVGKRVPALETNPAFANLYIANPLSAREIGGFFAKLFSTHPPVAERVARLREIKG